MQWIYIKTMNVASLRIKALYLTGFLFLQLTLFSQKNDTVYLINGDRITGELKKFEYGLLTFKTDAMNTVSIEYDRINTIYSNKFFEIRTSSEYRYFGSLAKSSTPATINIVITNDTLPTPMIEIVQMTTIKNRFFNRLDGSVDLGLSYTKASDLFQYNLNTKVSHRATNYQTEFLFNSILTDQKDLVTRKNDVGITLSRFFKGPVFAILQTKREQNTELNLDFRFQGGLGAGYDFVRTNSNRLYGVAGLLANRERTLDTQVESSNLEGLISVQYKWFRYRSPKIDVTSSLSAYPSFSVARRVRLDYNLQAKFEIIRDLFLGITIYDSYDNNPTDSNVAKNDWSVVTSLGYTF
ncbi:MAG: DUF481 domain-containing protein [Bacteroidetes bacterium]|nr:DUF481 domain-containing protein [Bacteroidota bacterium]